MFTFAKSPIVLGWILLLCACSSKNTTPVSQKEKTGFAQLMSESKIACPLKASPDLQAFVQISQKKLSQDQYISSDISPNESAEGGTVRFYALGENVQVIDEMFFGEMSKGAKTSYLSAHQEMFIQTIEWAYNRPFFWTLAMAKESGDDEGFDENKTKITITNMYINPYGKVEYYIDTDCAKEFDAVFLEDEKKNAIKAIEYRLQQYKNAR